MPAPEPSSAPPSPDQLREALRRVIDPEVGMNILDLGLIYDLAVGGEGVRVLMTTTSPACPAGSLMADEVSAALRAVLPPRTPVEVRLTWSPAWDRSRMSDTARRHFGW